MTDSRGLKLPPIAGLELTSGSFEVPTVVVRVQLKPELVGELLSLLAEAVEVGVDAGWFRPQFENAASSVVQSASTREFLPALVDVAELAHGQGLISSNDLRHVRQWAEQASATTIVPDLPSVQKRQHWADARGELQSWIDARDPGDTKRLLRQRSIARATCADCHSMLAWLVPQGEFEFLVLARGDIRVFEVGHAVGEYGGYARGRCGRRRGGRLWVLHADYLRKWLDEGNADVALRHTDKGL